MSAPDLTAGWGGEQDLEEGAEDARPDERAVRVLSRVLAEPRHGVALPDVGDPGLDQARARAELACGGWDASPVTSHAKTLLRGFVLMFRRFTILIKLSSGTNLVKSIVAREK